MTSSPLYPKQRPLRSGHLDVGDGHAVYWETCGTPGAPAALVLHGGPGSGCTEDHRRLFDPGRYHVALMDQRGCGRSRPDAADSAEGLTANTTARLIGDVEALRAHLGLRDWAVFGGSWGCTLALAYAQTHPARVRALVLAGVTSCRARELQWLYWDVGALFPEAHAAFRARVPGAASAMDLIAGYNAQLWGAQAQAAADAWCAWEAALIAVDPRAAPSPRWRDPRFRRRFARICAHYFCQGSFLDEGQVLGGMDRLVGIPGELIHSRFDPSAPLETAWLLSQAWPAARLTVLDGALHGATGGAMAAAVVAATDRFARLPG